MRLEHSNYTTINALDSLPASKFKKQGVEGETEREGWVGGNSLGILKTVVLRR